MSDYFFHGNFAAALVSEMHYWPDKPDIILNIKGSQAVKSAHQ